MKKSFPLVRFDAWVLQGVLLLDALVIGGIAALWLVQRLLVQISERLVTPASQAELLNVMDHLLPFFVYYGALAVVLTMLTSVVVGIKTRSWRLAALPLMIVSAVAVVPFLSF